MERVGVLVARAWLEHRDGNQLRVRITYTGDAAGRERVVTSAATLDAVCEQVRVWLEAFITASTERRDVPE